MKLYLQVRTDWEDLLKREFDESKEESKEELEAEVEEEVFVPQKTLVDTVLNYSLSDLFDLPRVEKMEPIESAFKHARHYADTFRPMIVEENRVGCRRSLEIHAQ